jgi:glucose/mannose-6-phosphate isomerase
MIDGTAGLRGHRHVDEVLLDDPAAMAKADPGQMLRHTAAGGPQLRESLALVAEANLSAIAEEGRPRAVVVAGQGTAARTGDILATVAGPRCPVPVIAHRSTGIPGWVGAADVVIAVSASGRSPEALGVADAAARRGARLVAIGAPDSSPSGPARRSSRYPAGRRRAPACGR